MLFRLLLVAVILELFLADRLLDFFRRQGGQRSPRFLPASSDQPIGEPQCDLALGRLGRVRAVHEVVRHGEREVAA